jgi:acyl carrier protein
MNAEEIKGKIKEHVGRLSGIKPDEIKDNASYRDDLGLDSLSMIELTVDLEYAFKIKVPEERLPEIRTVQNTVQLVQELSTAQA